MLARNSRSAVARRVGQLGLEVAEHVQLRVVRVGGVEVVLVVAAPEEGLAALDVLDVVGDRRRGVRSTSYSSSPKSSPTGPTDAHVGEEAGGEREVHGRAAEHALALAEGRLDRVERDRSDHDEAHSGGEASRQASCLGDLYGPQSRTLDGNRPLHRCSKRWAGGGATELGCADARVQIQEFGGPEVLQVVDLPEARARRRRGADRGLARGHELRRHPPARELLPRASTRCRWCSAARWSGTDPDGQRVVALLASGGYAEYAVAPRSHHLPDSGRGGRRRGAGAPDPGPDRVAPVPHLREARAGRARGRDLGRRRGRQPGGAARASRSAPAA